MCFVSMVMDQYQPYIPQPNQWPTVPITSPYTQPARPFVAPIPGAREVAELRELIESFRKSVEAAQAFDRLTGQPDCVDPEKAKLEERVAELERRLDAIGEAAASRQEDQT